MGGGGGKCQLSVKIKAVCQLSVSKPHPDPPYVLTGGSNF